LQKFLINWVYGFFSDTQYIFTCSCITSTLSVTKFHWAHFILVKDHAYGNRYIVLGCTTVHTFLYTYNKQINYLINNVNLNEISVCTNFLFTNVIWYLTLFFLVQVSNVVYFLQFVFLTLHCSEIDCFCESKFSFNMRSKQNQRKPAVDIGWT